MEESLQAFVRTHFHIFVGGAADDTPMQMFVLEDGEGGLTMIMAPWSSHKEKLMVLLEVAHMINETNAQRYVVLSEVWKSTKAIEEGVPPSQASDRASMLMAVGVERGGQTHAMFAPVAIAADGSRTIGLPELFDADTSVGGDLTTLFTGADRLKILGPQAVEILRKASSLTRHKLDDGDENVAQAN
jgi:hypothetical protein